MHYLDVIMARPMSSVCSCAQATRVPAVRARSFLSPVCWAAVTTVGDGARTDPGGNGISREVSRLHVESIAFDTCGLARRAHDEPRDARNLPERLRCIEPW